MKYFTPLLALALLIPACSGDPMYSQEGPAKTAADGSFYCRVIATPTPDHDHWTGGWYVVTQVDGSHVQYHIDEDQFDELKTSGEITFKNPTHPFYVDLVLLYSPKGGGEDRKAIYDRFTCS